MTGLIFSFSTVALCLVISLAFADDILVNLPNGQIQGWQFETPANQTVFAFQGIPYAAPPTGTLRFQAPVPVENWDGIFDARKDGPGCISTIPQDQLSHTTPMGKDDRRLPSITDTAESEDCLFINVYTPRLPSNASNTELLPVMFWIYGGSFYAGSSSIVIYGPDYLVQEDIVFVSFNYRVGPFGFLSTGDEVIPGNAGLKDQNLALRWTYENIHLFGGDKEKITIFGESAGSASVTYHLLSNQSAGLFRAAIAESGTALASWAVNTDPLSYAQDLISTIAENNNITIDNSTLTSKGLLSFLANQTADNIKAAATDAKFSISLKNVPVIEYPHENAFISEANYQLLDSGKINRVPLIVGFNSEEYLYFIKSMDNLEKLALNFDYNIDNLIPSDLILEDSANKTEVADEIKKIYISGDDVFSFNLGAVVRYMTDCNFVTPIIKYAELQSKLSDVYFYQFSYNGELGRMHTISVNGTLGDVGHAEDLLYLFKVTGGLGKDTSDLSKYPAQDVLTQNRMVKMWTNFAKFLNPTPEKSELFQNISWPTLNQSGFRFLNINENLEIVNDYPREGSFQQWNKTYNTWGVKPFITF